ncbi:uncharacterized protein B0H18DRAFT_973526 [Fomitopsis serialis]|uniref:uncharacterized protein n=1 Tax=Fomitopsis serialis TaxID=139415 RepID=UPI002008926D|nr:uncharacterized protein B0H18DRAFT_973526 [Neoantrodia serialis]KAH9936355.1 hypothetical protein B0H18DRAFT_973526 [Neoantrodia serialis]
MQAISSVTNEPPLQPLCIISSRKQAVNKSGATEVFLSLAEADEIEENLDVFVCVYCREPPGMDHGVMLTCTSCGAMACYGQDGDCIQPKADVAFDPSAFVCPVCMQRSGRRWNYIASDIVKHLINPAVSVNPVLLVTAFFDRPGYFGPLLSTQMHAEYDLVPYLINHVDVHLTVEGTGRRLATSTKQAREWLKSQECLNPAMLLVIEAHSDPLTGHLSYRRNKQQKSLVASAREVASMLLSDIYNDLPRMSGLRGLVLHEQVLKQLVYEKRFNFIVGFVASGVVPPMVGIPLLTCICALYLKHKQILDAVVQAFGADSNCLKTVGVHLTYHDLVGKIQQHAYVRGNMGRAWGIMFQCPNIECSGCSADVRPRKHKTHDTYRFRCDACHYRTKEYIGMPAWIELVGTEPPVYRYPLLVNGEEATRYFIGKLELVEWEKVEDREA